MLDVKFKKLHKDAIIPKYQTSGSAGFDFHALVKEDHPVSLTSIQYEPGNSVGVATLKIRPKEQFIVKTGLACAIPTGYEIQIRPRSGLAAKHMISVTNSPGTIDADYRLELMIIVINLGEKEFIINNGDRIAQGVVKKVEQANIIEVDELDETDRKGGLGSTGR